MRSRKAPKRPEWHEIQRLKNLCKHIALRFDAGAYDDNPDGHKRASVFLETSREKIRKLEVIEKANGSR